MKPDSPHFGAMVAPVAHVAKANAVTLVLPWAPSVNHYWFARGSKRFIGRAGKAFHEAVKIICLVDNPPCLTGRLSVQIEARPPDKRKRDIDNVLKVLL